jgi:multidrug efflux pump subunit AcrA (membrane-fusion protein)
MNTRSPLRTNLVRRTLLGLSAAVLAAGCAKAPPPRVDGARPVKTIIVDAGTEERTRAFPGVVEASRRVELAFRVPGLVVTLPIREGQKVKAGEVIGELRKDEFKARLTNARAQYDRFRTLLRESAVSRVEFEVAQTECG